MKMSQAAKLAKFLDLLPKKVNLGGRPDTPSKQKWWTNEPPLPDEKEIQMPYPIDGRQGQSFGRLLCLVDAKQYDKAIEEAKRMQESFDEDEREIYYPKSFYLLATIYEMKKDKNIAVKNYNTFLSLCKDANGDLPDLADARTRLTELNRTSTS
jgi:tetratricopeptide (TPR) repeat protein